MWKAAEVVVSRYLYCCPTISHPFFIAILLSTLVGTCVMLQAPAWRQNPALKRRSLPVRASGFASPSNAVANCQIPPAVKEVRPLCVPTSARSQRGTLVWQKHWVFRPIGLIGTKRPIVKNSLRLPGRTRNLSQLLRRAWQSMLSNPRFFFFPMGSANPLRT
jgi:hypothetical protein